MPIFNKMETRCLSSLAKVFPDQELNEPPFVRGSALLNETYSFQVAFRATKEASHALKHVQVHAESGLGEMVSVRLVGLVPSELPIYGDHDEYILRSTPGLYPDPLFPIDATEGVAVLPHQWRSVWITVEPVEPIFAGLYPIRVLFVSESGETLAEEQFELELIPAYLPKQTLVHTEWFHTDCLATYYQVEVFSEAHWSIIEAFIRSAVRRGMNMLLTPLFTPPLDMKVGGERTTVQLVDVYKKGRNYTFGFERLKRWVELCDKCGVWYFEFSHLFTQWGAKHAPKIMAEENGL